MQIRTIWMRFKAFERDSKYSNANLNSSNKIWHIGKQILTIRKEFDTFKTNEIQSIRIPNLNQSQVIQTIWIKILTIQKGFKSFEPNFKHLNANSNHLRVIWSIWMQILTIQTKFEAFECKFDPFKQDLKH